MVFNPRPDELDDLVRFELSADTATHPNFEGLAFRREIRLILCALRDKAPSIYAFFRKASVEDFHVALDEDIQSPDRFEELSIEQFCSQYKHFRPKDSIFSLNFMTYSTEQEREKEYKTSSMLECSPDGLSLYSVPEPDPAAAIEEIIAEFPHFMLYLCRKAILANKPLKIIAEFPHFMLYLCRKAILANKPLKIDAETIEYYSLSNKDAAVVQKLVARCNETIIAELRARYETLAAIDCLQTKPCDDEK